MPSANSSSSSSESRRPQLVPLSSPSPPGSPPNKDVSSSRQLPSRGANMAARRASPSSDSSSQSGMADNETEAEPSQHSERSAPQAAAAPPKKKRTRTLTTPHQSAVLHALLAKSRFPSTAMREEVGRQIGLSARKVQIWFQNQRQKARRPQGESGPLTRPPQFGPFPIMTATGPSSPYPSPSTAGPSPEVSPLGPSSARSAGSLDSIPPLSGPGMPGWSSESHPRRHSSAEERDTPRRTPTSPQLPLGASQPPWSSDGMSIHDARGTSRSLAPHPAAQGTSPHLSRVLPPIALELRTSAEPCMSATSSFPPPSSRNFVNTVRRHDPSARPAIEPGSGPTSLAIPPPFALQPQPQWDPHAFTPFTRPEFASWSHPSRSARSSFSAVGAHDRVTHDPSPRGRHYYTSSGEPRRSGQLDPPLPYHMIPPSRGEGHSTSASSPCASTSGQVHAREDDRTGEA